MSIVAFSLPAQVVAFMVANEIDTDKVVNAVQSELNMGQILKGNQKSRVEWKDKKDDEGNTYQVIDVTSKAGEKLRLQNTKPAKFYAWCNCWRTLNTFANTSLVMPEYFTAWFKDKFLTQAALDRIAAEKAEAEKAEAEKAKQPASK